MYKSDFLFIIFVFVKRIVRQMKIVYITIISFLLLLGCNNTSSNANQDRKIKTKTVEFEEFKIPNLTEKALDDVQQWKSFRSLVQVIINVSPHKVKNADKLVADSTENLLIYKRFSVSDKRNVLQNMSIDRDWRTTGKVKDTIFRLQKLKLGEASVTWNNYLIKEVPYTFSIFVKPNDYKKFAVEIGLNNQKQLEHIFSLETDLAVQTSPNSKIIPLEDNWKEIQLVFTPQQEESYGIKMYYDEDAQVSESILFYRPTLQVKAKDLQKIKKSSAKIVKDELGTESSYATVLFWMKQIENEIRHLIEADDYPEKVNHPMIKSRFHLLYTQVRELCDNLQNNPAFNETQVKGKIAEIQYNFNTIILKINKIYESTLDQRMQEVQKGRDSLM